MKRLPMICAVLSFLTLLAGCSPATSTNAPDPSQEPATLTPDERTITASPFHPASSTMQPALPTETPPQPTATPSKPVVCDPNAPEPPITAYIEGVVGQPQAYSLSCEARSAADLAEYWDVDIQEGVFFSQIPKAENPDEGFVGFVSGAWGEIPPKSYGVHAQPVADLMVNYGLEAEAHKGLTFRCLQSEIAAGRPVIVWIVGHAWAGLPVPYLAPDGAETIVAPYEHTMIFFGYDANNVHMIDAYTSKVETHSIDSFLVSWAALDNMALTVIGADASAASQMAYTGEYYEVQYGDSLLGLANAWGVPWDSLAALNGIVYPFSIYPGQVLKSDVSTGVP
jgi:uncharacterized protein YvpB